MFQEDKLSFTYAFPQSFLLSWKNDNPNKLFSIWNEIINSCADLASTNAEDIRRQLAAAGVELIEGLASFPDSGGTDSLFVTKTNWAVETIKADKILIATGSTPFRPSGIPFDGSRVFDSDSINQVR